MVSERFNQPQLSGEVPVFRANRAVMRLSGPVVQNGFLCSAGLTLQPGGERGEGCTGPAQSVLYYGERQAWFRQ